MNVLIIDTNKDMSPPENTTLTQGLETQINQLVDKFYGRVHSDERLGVIFEKEITGTWDEHLETMKAFWRSVLLKTREYQGRPVPKHQKLKSITTEDFVRWLSLFRLTANEVFNPEYAQKAIHNAENIASSLWLSVNEDPFKTPPNWATLN